MKKKIIVVLFAILFVILLLIISRNKKVYTEIDGIKYAILVDGNYESSFPNGNYKVDVECTNAHAYWDDFQDKIIINDITGTVLCDISFNSITGSDNLINYIIDNDNLSLGDGNLVHEIVHVPNYSNAEIVTSFSNTPSYFEAGQNSNTPNTIDAYWSYNESTGVFTSNPSLMTVSSKYYHAYVGIVGEGYYEVCYTIAKSSSTKNRIYIGRNATSKTYTNASTSSQVGELCYDLGFLSTNDYINVSEYAYSGVNSPIITFNIKKAVTTTSIDSGYRYEGKNPNNYIWFNNELWRIIGVFETEYDSNNDGTNDTTNNLVKIIRSASLGAIVKSNNNSGDWTSTTLYHLLNDQYYDWESNKNNVQDNCYAFTGRYVGDTVSLNGNCDYSIKGIKDNYRDLIVNAKWYLGSSGKSGYLINIPEYLYRYERDNTAIYSGYAAVANGHVGLMYVSDYLYGALATDCSRSTEFSLYDTVNCAGKNWLYGFGNEWTIANHSNVSNSGYFIGDNGIIRINGTSIEGGNNIRPTVFLSPNIYRVSGSGTITDPYIIGMAS